MNRFEKTISLAITGASGAAYAIRLLETLLAARVRVYLMISRPGQIVLGSETDIDLPGRPAGIQRLLSERYAAAEGQLRVFGQDEWTAPVASGTSAPDAMIVCPCTTGTLAAVATGMSRSLLERAADVVLKEGRRLVLVVRETPFSAIHLEHMLGLARLGVVILPANPGFYLCPETVSDLVDFVVARVLDQVGIAHDLSSRWGAQENR
ncbi:MAG: flavin prenyltransferase UbiX [Pseudomonadota bacterium]|nr:flavin prenyltransferase UbiX [Pseudomonadota bacterium]